VITACLVVPGALGPSRERVCVDFVKDLREIFGQPSCHYRPFKSYDKCTVECIAWRSVIVMHENERLI